MQVREDFVAPDTSSEGLSRPRSALLIANANSRSGDRADAARAALEKAGLSVRLAPSVSADALPELVRTQAASVDCVVAAGGDGTMNAIADGIADTGLPLGILPMGTANDLARTLGLPAAIEDCAAVIAAGKARRIDLGEVNGHTFFNVASIGISADLARSLTPDRKRRFGRFAYAITAAGVLARAKPFRATILMEGREVRVRTLQIAVGNGRFYGGGMAVAADAEINDGALDLYSLELRGVWKLALMLRSFRSGLHGLWNEVRTERGLTFEVRTRRRHPVNADGEILTHTPARFSIRRQAVAVYVP